MKEHQYMNSLENKHSNLTFFSTNAGMFPKSIYEAARCINHT